MCFLSNTHRRLKIIKQFLKISLSKQMLMITSVC